MSGDESWSQEQGGVKRALTVCSGAGENIKIDLFTALRSVIQGMIFSCFRECIVQTGFNIANPSTVIQDTGNRLLSEKTKNNNIFLFQNKITNYLGRFILVTYGVEFPPP